MAGRTTSIKERIRLKHELLTSELQVSTLVDYLYEKKALIADDIERIAAEVTTQDKARRFLRIMAYGSEESNSLFIEILGMLQFQPYLAQEILDTKVPDSDDDAEKQELSSWKPMQEWSVDSVCLWLKTENVDHEVIDCFRKEKISGAILANIKKEDFSEFGQTIAFGDRIAILRLRDSELTKQIPNPHTTSLNGSSVSDNCTSCSEEILVSATFRNFGRKTDSAFPMTLHTYFPSESSAIDNLIEPVHRYVGAEHFDSLAGMYEVSLDIVTFICACLNDRTNGTFHLGVSKDGKIHGITTQMDEFQHLLNELIDGCFFPDQLDIVKNCVRPVRLVKVVPCIQSDRNQETDKLHVLEVDVVPAYSLCTEQAFFAKAPKQNSKTGHREYERTKVFRFQNGFQPGPISDKILAQFMENKANLAKRRQEAEQELENPKLKGVRTSDLGKKLVRLLCPGGNSLDESDIYPIFVMSSAPDLQSNADDFIANTKFINYLERKAVFDFDDGRVSTSVYRNHADNARTPLQRFIVSSSAETDSKRENEDLVTLLKECISSGSACQPWIFCNGHEATRDRAMGVPEWKRTRRSDILKAIDVFDKAFPRGRTVVVFLLFWENYEVLASVAQEFCLKFKGNWVVISETPEVATRFKDYLINRDFIVADDKEFNKHSVVGMPWLHVNEAIIGLAGDFAGGDMSIPTSSGTPIGISRELLNELPDIEVLGSNHLSNVLIDDEELDKLELEKEQSFYQGKEVDWWNFHFKSHVLERDQLREILICTRSALSGTYFEEQDSRVGVVVIDHQPGSGATTLAKNVLWELKTEYRCTVLRSFTNDTANQLCHLLQFGEPTDPKAVLLLLDNTEKVHELKELLEIEVQKLVNGGKHFPTVTFVLLVVSRCSSAEETAFARENSCPRYFLGHSLSQVELQLFSRKFDEMETDSRKRKRLEPRFLLSFNILRNNFSEDYVKRTVPRLIQLVTDPEERKLLEYVAFVGVFDPDNNSIPTSCFDWLMNRERALVSSSDSAWLSKTSKYLKILLNDNSRNRMSTKSIRIIHSSLAQEIYTVLAGNRPVSEVCLEFLQSNVFQTYLNLFKDDLFRIVNNITVKREKRADGKNKAEFSPVVQKIRESQEDDTTKIVEILELAFRMTDNVYIAQHLARYFMSLQEWQEAEQWAKTATDMEPNKEVLWNTYAHVFSNQFYQRFLEGSVDPKSVEDSLELAVTAMHLYKCEQYANDREIVNNPTGLLYEGDTIVNLIEILQRIRGLREGDIRAFLVDASFVPQCFKSWKKSSIQTVKSLPSRAMGILTELEEDKYHQDKDRAFIRIMSYEVKRLNERMIKITETFMNYFGEESNETPKNLLPEEAASYRRRRIFRLKGNTFSRILELCSARNVRQLQMIKSLAEENVTTPYRNATDLQTFIGASLALFFLSDDARSEANNCLLKPLTNLSRELLQMSNLSESNRAPLETYMFFALLNWPTSSSSHHEQDLNNIVDVLAKWKEAYQLLNPVLQGKLQNRMRLKKVLFFLGNGTGMNRIVPFSKKSRNVEKFTGILICNGQKIKTAIDSRNPKCVVEIETVEVENNRSLWNNNVFFELGFTWAGPVVCITSMDDPRRISSQSGGRNRVSAFVGGEYPESSSSSSRFNARGPSQVMNPSLQQQPYSPGGMFYGTPGAAAWHRHQFQEMMVAPQTFRQPFQINVMPPTRGASFIPYKKQFLPPRTPN